MLDFKTPQLSDKAWVSAIMRESGELACEYCFGNLYMWCTVYGNTIARYGDLFLARDGTEKPAYLFPCGKGDKKKAVLELKESAKADGSPLTLYCLTPKKVRELDCMFPGEFDFQPTREYFDYIYNTQDLIDLAGRRYHGKRNHIAYFKKTFDWHYEPLTERNMADCLAMNEKWEQRNREKNPEDIDNELVAIHRAFDSYFDLEFTGGVLYADGEIVAYTFGEPLNDTAFCTHVEKAFADVRGAYPAINREFAANALSGFHFVNREEDAGSEGLRRAKESYYPVVLLPKYTAVCKEWPMELRTACDTDIPALYALWHEAFGDEQPVIDAFFQTCYIPENTLVAAENGMPVSVLYWIEADYRSVGETFSARYIFAAATAKSARSKGYMSALLDYARRTAEKRQIDLLFLVPAEETLFAYYGARGYINAFSKTVYNLTDAQLLRCAGALAKRREPTAEQWASARETALHAVPHIVWNEPALRLALRYGAMFDTEILVADDGYFTAERDGETVAVSEFCTVNGALPALCGALLETVPAKRYTLCTPCGIQVPTVFGKGETVQNGMLLPLSDRAKRTARIKDAYIGITLG